MSLGSCQQRGTTPSLAIRLFVLQASKEIPGRWSKGLSPPPHPAGEPSIALQGWSEAGTPPQHSPIGELAQVLPPRAESWYCSHHRSFNIRKGFGNPMGY